MQAELKVCVSDRLLLQGHYVEKQSEQGRGSQPWLLGSPEEL